MSKRCISRLTVIGKADPVRLFTESKWETELKVRFCELMETSEERYVCIFRTNGVPLEGLRQLSLGWPDLSLILDYEVEESQLTGLAVAKSGRINHCQLSY